MKLHCLWGLSVVLLLPILIARNALEDVFQNVVKVCIKEQNVRYRNLEDTGEPNPDLVTKMKCFSYCYFEKLSVLDEDGKFDLDKALAVAAFGADVKELIIKCKKQFDEKKDNCE